MQPDTTPIGAGALSREELIAMAREADPFGDDGRLVSLAMLTPGTLERFAALVLEQAAQKCDQTYYQHIGAAFGETRFGIAACAKAIRAMKPKETP